MKGSPGRADESPWRARSAGDHPGPAAPGARLSNTTPASNDSAGRPVDRRGSARDAARTFTIASPARAAGARAGVRARRWLGDSNRVQMIDMQQQCSREKGHGAHPLGR